MEKVKPLKFKDLKIGTRFRNKNLQMVFIKIENVMKTNNGFPLEAQYLEGDHIGEVCCMSDESEVESID